MEIFNSKRVFAIALLFTCLGLVGPVLPSMLNAADISTATARNAWVKFDNKIAYFGDSSKIQKEFAFEDKKTPLRLTAEFTETAFSVVTGGVAGNGKYAWLFRKESDGKCGSNLFQYFDSSGIVLWSTDSVVGVNVSSNGELIFTLEVDPKWIASLEYGNSPYYPFVYSSTGAIVSEIYDCVTYDADWHFSTNNKYASLTCFDSDSLPNAYQLILTLPSFKQYLWRGVGGIDVNSIRDDGSFTAIEEVQEKNPKTGMFEYVVKSKTNGKLE